MNQTPLSFANDNNRQKKIPLVEMFGPTIQGEGSTIGLPTYFFRFGLCDYKCTMCDSMHAVDPAQVKLNAFWMTQDEIFNHFDQKAWEKPSTDWITFSGGNPCIHDLTKLVGLLRSARYKIAVETQGTFAPNWLFACDVVTVSPKGPGMGEIFEKDKFEHFVQKFRHHPGLAIKVVVFDDADIDFATHVRELTGNIGIPQARFFLSQGNPYPPGHTMQPGISLVAELQKHYLETFDKLKNHWLLCDSKFLPQLHVWLWGNRQGV